MARWRHLVFDAITREPQAELSAVGDDAGYSEVLNSPGSGHVTLPLSAVGVTKQMILPPRAIYAVERNDVLVWAGPVITHDYDLRGRTVTLGCEGWWNYLRRQHNFNNQTFTLVEQTTIAQTLLQYAESWAGANFAIDYSGVVATGITRTRKYYYYEHGAIGTLVEQLAAVSNGFDWRFYPAWSAGPNSTMTLKFATSYPATGRVTNVLLDLDANSAVEQVLLDAANLSYVAIVEGLGQGEDMLTATTNNAAKITANLRLGSVETRGDISVAGTLNAYATQRLIRGAEPIVVPRVNVSADLLDELIVGDQVRVRADMGLLSLDAMYRITKWDVSAGTERMTLELAPLTAFV